MSANFPAGTVTFLFTDIEGSSRLWEEQPAAMGAALARHDGLLQEIMAAHGGHVFKMSGDGLHAAFAQPSEAVAAALACQLVLNATDWSSLPRPLVVRMSLHSGEAELRGGDYFGATVNRVARLMTLAAGGQTLLSAATTELVRDRLPPGASLRELGEHRLKDLVRPEHIYQLNTPGSIATFPPLRASDALLHNLPVQLTSFIGREAELAEVKRLLTTTHLLTLSGTGGTGKTRLALQTAADILETIPQGAWLVELAPLADPALLPQAVAAALGVRVQPGHAPLDALLDYLRPKHLLLVLDNCEHLLTASAQLVSRLLTACPQLKLLVTSREALGLAGEAAFRVPSLAMGDVRTATPDELARSAAVRLFVERAQAVQSRFQLTSENLFAVAQICERLDGIPLALELAAARVKVFSAEQIAARLDDRFRLLTGGSRTALPRQQTLQALIDWSCDLLSEAERAAWRQLSVFAGGFTFEAAEAVLGTEALEWLSHLADKSLVVVEDQGAHGATRYRLLETIRQYGRDKLLEAGEASATRDRHLAHYLGLALDAEPMLSGPDMVSVLNRLEVENDNFRAAFEWALGREPDAALHLAASLKYYWVRRRYGTEGRQWLHDSLARVAPSTKTGFALRAKGLLTLGTVDFGYGELNLARPSLEESVDLSRTLGAVRTLAQGLGMLAFVTLLLGDEVATKAVLTEGLSLASQTNDPELRAELLIVQSQQAAQQNDYVAARAATQAALELLRRQGDPWFVATTLTVVVALDGLEGRWVEARVHAAEAEGLFREMGARHMMTAVQSERAHIERRSGQYAQATALYTHTISVYLEHGLRPAVLHEVECLAFIAIAQGHGTRAACLLGASEALRESFNSPMTSLERSEYGREIARLQIASGDDMLSSAWAKGRAMTLDEAISFAITEKSCASSNQMGQSTS